MLIIPTDTLRQHANTFRTLLLGSDTRATYAEAVALRDNIVLTEGTSSDETLELDIPGYEEILAAHLDQDGPGDADYPDDRPDGIEDADTMYIAIIVMQALNGE